MLMGPGTLGLAATQINLLINTQLAVGQGTGAVSWLQYAFRLMNLPIGLFGVSIATAVLPAVARHAAIDDRQAIEPDDGARDRVDAHGQRAGQRWTVSAGDTNRPAAARTRPFSARRYGGDGRGGSVYAIGLVGYSAARIASPVFYALRRSRVAVILSTVTIARQSRGSV